MSKVKIVTKTPGPAPKANEYADIQGHGRIPYGKTAPAPIGNDEKTQQLRGMGKARTSKK